MKRIIYIKIFLMLIPLIFSMGFQSFHEFEHLKVQLSEQNCNHSTNQKNQITHEHHGYDNCSTCEFTISHFLTTQNIFFQIKKSTLFFENNFLFFKSITNYFLGSNFLLRGPPF